MKFNNLIVAAGVILITIFGAALLISFVGSILFTILTDNTLLLALPMAAAIKGITGVLSNLNTNIK